VSEGARTNSPYGACLEGGLTGKGRGLEEGKGQKVNYRGGGKQGWDKGYVWTRGKGSGSSETDLPRKAV